VTAQPWGDERPSAPGKGNAMTLSIAGLQTPGTLRDVRANLRELESAAEEAARNGAELIITPEMFATGYVVGDVLPELAAQDFLSPVRALAARLGIAVLLGAPELTEAGVYNAAFFVDDRGELLSCYRKSHLFGDLDRSQFVAGEELFGLVEFRGVRIATMICYDVEFPEVVRAAALAGAHLVAVPTAQMEPFGFIAEQLVRTRAWENQVYVAYIDHDGAEEDLTYVGRSSIIAPDATVLDSVEHGTRLIYATVDPGVVAVQQKANPYLGDRRAPLYPALTDQRRTNG
jgi:5-aminopentanamidase